MTTEAAALLLTAKDVAQLAGVQRPVVSVWRRRHGAAVERPFPSPVGAVGDVEAFDGAEVARWLVETGHGNNPSAGEDLATFATVAGVSHRTDDDAFAAVTAALCLSVISGEVLGDLDGAEVLDLADECDPDDELLFGELERVSDRIDDIVGYAQMRADAALGMAAAFEDLLRDRTRRSGRGPRTPALREEVHALVARIAVGLAASNEGTATYAAPMLAAPDLLLAVVAEHGERGAPEVLVPWSSDAESRLAHRRLRVHDVVTRRLEVAADGSFVAEPDVVHVVDLPLGRRDARADLAALEAVDHVLLQMDDTQRGVVVGPVDALTDGFGGGVDGLRAELLRTGRVKAVVRLPRGLLRDGSRQALGLWLLGSSEPSVGPADRVTWIADLANVALTGAAIEDLASDLVAIGSGVPAVVRGRARAYARPARTTVLQAARASLVEASPTSVRREAETQPVATRLARVRAGMSPLGAPELPGLRERPEAFEGRRASTLGDLVKRRWLRVVAGTRYEQGHLQESHGYPVIGAEELVGLRGFGTRRIDPLVHGAYPSARLTEPGDVVFCTTPRPAAYVDHEGTSVVLSPARVLRVRPAAEGMSPDVIAADINGERDGAREWRRWQVRSIGAADVTVLAGTLTAVRRARELAQERLRQLDDIEDLIIEGVAAGTLIVDAGAVPQPVRDERI